MLNASYFKLSWWIIRLSGLLMLPGIFYDFEIIVLIYGIILVHLKLGLESIVNDYIHDKATCILYLLFLRLLSLEMLYLILDFLL
jgi:succinate dehydrogenase hydrophobic anchor subunit|nr:succinate:cytochrome c oxidoreductase subunit 4 [Kumanoa mahlacensis]AVK39537.1 succinate:cytochrome c oxidoreductase subunit 4 [Kumanoa mahlacensis]